MRSMKEIAQLTDWLRETVGGSFRACNDMRGCEQIFEMKLCSYLTSYFGYSDIEKVNKIIFGCAAMTCENNLI